MINIMDRMEEPCKGTSMIMDMKGWMVDLYKSSRTPTYVLIAPLKLIWYTTD